MTFPAQVRPAFLALLAAALVGVPPAGPVFATDVPASAVTSVGLNPAHDQVQPGESLGAPLVRSWALTLEGQLGNPIVVNGRVFVAARRPRGEPEGARIHAFDLATGQRIWGPVELRGPAYPTGLAYDGGRLFAQEDDGVLRAFTASTGAELWATDLSLLPSPYTAPYQFNAPPTARNGIVYSHGSGSGSELYAVDAATGAVRWTIHLNVGVGEAPAVDGSGVYLADDCEDVRVSLTGVLVWRNEHGCNGGRSQRVQLIGDRMYVGQGSGPRRIFEKLTGAALGIAATDRPVAVTGRTVVAIEHGTVTARDVGSGRSAWRNALDGWPGDAPVVAGGYAFVANRDRYVSAIDMRTGRTAWSALAYDNTDPAEQFGIQHIAPGQRRLTVVAGPQLTVFAPPAASIRGPERVLFGTSVPLVVHSAPGVTVSIYLKRSGVASYSLLSTLVTDETGRAETSFSIRGDTSYYAVAGGVRSATGSTRVTERTSIPSGAPGTRATTYQLNPAHDGSQPGELLAPPLRLAWSLDLPGNVSYPVVFGARAFVTVDRPDPYDTNTDLYAFEAATGRALWGPIPITGRLDYSALTTDGQRLFVISAGVIRALDPATGNELWSAWTPWETWFETPPTAQGGRVHLEVGASAYAAVASTGEFSWIQPTRPSSAPALSSDRLFVADDCLNVEAFTADGDRVWTEMGRCTGGSGGVSVFRGGRLYVRSGSEGNWVFDAASGQRLHRFPPLGVQLPFAVPPAPAFSGSTGFVVWGGRLVAFDVANGAERWSVAGDGRLVTAPVVARGVVYAGSSAGTLFAFSAATGAVLWSGKLGTAIRAPREGAGQVLQGLAIAEGRLFVPAGRRLAVLSVAVTARGPTSTTYGGTVTLTAVTAPGVSVQFQLRRRGTTRFTAYRTVASDGAGVARTSYVALDDYSWRAVAVGIVSNTGTTQIAPTLRGPASVPRGSTVQLSGTGRPGASVGIYMKRHGTSTYVLRRTATVSSSGAYSTSYVADTTYSYYAASGCCRSSVITTSVQ